MTLVLFLVVVIAISIIGALGLVCYAIKRKPNIAGDEVGRQAQKDVGIWKFFIVFGLLFLVIPASGLVYQNVRTQGFKEISAEISELRTVRTGTKRKQSVYLSYEFSGKKYENIYANISIKQYGLKNPTKVGQKIVVLVNPDNPSQIIAFNNLFNGILLALVLIGILISTTGIYNFIRTRNGKSKWRTADEPPLVSAEEEGHKGSTGRNIFIIAFCGGILLFVYLVASFRTFLFFVAWIIFLAIYGMWTKHKEKKQKS